MNFTNDELNILYDYIIEMLVLFEEDEWFYNSNYNIKFNRQSFIELKNKIELMIESPIS